MTCQKSIKERCSGMASKPLKFVPIFWKLLRKGRDLERKDVTYYDFRVSIAVSEVGWNRVISQKRSEKLEVASKTPESVLKFQEMQQKPEKLERNDTYRSSIKRSSIASKSDASMAIFAKLDHVG